MKKKLGSHCRTILNRKGSVDGYTDIFSENFIQRKKINEKMTLYQVSSPEKRNNIEYPLKRKKIKKESNKHESR